MELSGRGRRLLRAGGVAAVMAVAAGTRLWGLGEPQELVFDETYYVKDAWTLLHLGYESRWPDGANEGWAAGDPSAWTTEPSFIAHPPLGRWVIALGLMTLGPETAWGWRVPVAIAGILLVAVTMLLAGLLFRSWPIALMTGGLLAIDGNAIVMSRVALLDGILALLVVVGFVLVVLDRRWVKRRLAAWREARAGAPPGAGPVLWWRPWLLAAGLALGMSSAVKWSGLYVLAAVGIATVVSDAVLFRRAGVELWPAVVLRQGPVNALLLLPVAAAAHLASWTGWFATDGGYYRHWVEGPDGEAWGGLLAWVPDAFQSWWHYQAAMLGYHESLTVDHSYEAPPATWLVLLRPTSMWFHEGDDGSAAEIIGLANPLIWWASAAAIVALLLRVAVRVAERRPVASEALVLLGAAAGYLPWFLYPERTTFQFYTIVFEPFLVIALALWLAMLLGRPDEPRSTRRVGMVVVAVFLVACAALSVWFWPLWSGTPLGSYAELALRFWFRSWV